MNEISGRRYPIGAEVMPSGGAHFRVWAPRSKSVEVLLSETPNMERAQGHLLTAEDHGYFSGQVENAKAGQFYKYRLDQGTFPDPASRFQPEGSHGPSQLIDPNGYGWRDQNWEGLVATQQVIYEMHVGTFTEEGTFAGITQKLPHLAELGITIIELMPIADFPGRYGWGYDGVNFFAPTRLYGTPDDLREMVDSAHALGIGVILDVVYNHVGPDGNYLREYSQDYFSSRHANEWGDALNFDDANCGSVREFFLSNAAYWIQEFHLDGLRLDATQAISDDSSEHIIKQVGQRVRDAAVARQTFLVAENEPQQSRLVRSIEKSGFGLDAVWNDDFHHSAIVALTGRKEAYYTDYKGIAQEFISMAKFGFLYQGQHYTWQKAPRGTPSLDLEPWHFVTFIQNHDQIANSLRGERIHTIGASGAVRAMTALLLLGPGTPMLFQGQEFAASTLFLYFADHNPELARQVALGRTDFLKQFPSLAQPDVSKVLQDPENIETFLKCKLKFEEKELHRTHFDLHRDLIALRRSDSVIGRTGRDKIEGAVLNPECFVLRYFGENGDERMLIVNLGKVFHFEVISDPLLAPPAGQSWRQVWCSDDICYGGGGVPPLSFQDNAFIPGQVAVLLATDSKEKQHEHKARS